jgi:hypothetical protein
LKIQNLLNKIKKGKQYNQISLNKPIEVLFEGADLTKYFPSKETNKLDLKHVKENFAFLSYRALDAMGI